jgi:hypothetical protein
MRMMSEVKGKRAMLNLPGYHSTGAIVAEVKVRKGSNPTCTFQLADCDRSLSLDFDFYGSDKDADWENNIYKCEMLFEAISEFRKVLNAEHRKYLRRKAKEDT